MALMARHWCPGIEQLLYKHTSTNRHCGWEANLLNRHAGPQIKM